MRETGIKIFAEALHGRRIDRGIVRNQSFSQNIGRSPVRSVIGRLKLLPDSFGHVSRRFVPDIAEFVRDAAPLGLRKAPCYCTDQPFGPIADSQHRLTQTPAQHVMEERFLMLPDSHSGRRPNAGIAWFHRHKSPRRTGVAHPVCNAARPHRHHQQTETPRRVARDPAG